MRIHKGKDRKEFKTELQWMKEGYRVKKNAIGEVMWTNSCAVFQDVYYTRKDVRKSSAALREYKELIRQRRKTESSRTYPEGKTARSAYSG